MSSKDSYVCTLSVQSIEKAAKELHETPETRGPALARLREAVLGYPGLTCPTDDAYLLRFLRAKRFDHERALQLIIQSYRVRNDYPDIYDDNWKPSAVKAVAEAGIRNVLPFKDSEGRQIIWLRMGMWSPDLGPFIDMVRYDTLEIENTVEDEEVQVNGIVGIADFANFGMMKAFHMTPSVGKKQAKIFQDAVPLRIKEIHYVNEPGVISYIFPMIKQFVKKKLMDRIYFHGCDMKSLHKFISPDLLPSELGGTLPEWPAHHKKMLDSFLASDEKFIEMKKYKLVEDTPGLKYQDIKEDALQGMSGVFRKLSVD